MKYCTRCGGGNLDESSFCSQCGNKLESSGAAPTPEKSSLPDIPPVPEIPRPESFGARPEPQPQAPPQAPPDPPRQPQYTAYQPSPMNMNVPRVDKGNSVLWLVLNIVLAVLCCCTVIGFLGTICAIIGVVFAGMALSRANSGDAATARQYEKVAMILFFVALGVGIISIIVGVATNAGQFNDFTDYYGDFFSEY